MNLEVTRHDERLSALWVNTNNVDIAKIEGQKFLDTLETTEVKCEIKSCVIWKKNKSQCKIEYKTIMQPNSKVAIRWNEIHKQKYSIVIIDNLTKSRSEMFGDYKFINSKINGLTIESSQKIINLPIGESLTIYYTINYNSDTQDLEYTIIRLS